MLMLQHMITKQFIGQSNPNHFVMNKDRVSTAHCLLNNSSNHHCTKLRISLRSSESFGWPEQKPEPKNILISKYWSLRKRKVESNDMFLRIVWKHKLETTSSIHWPQNFCKLFPYLHYSWKQKRITANARCSVLGSGRQVNKQSSKLKYFNSMIHNIC